MQSVAPSSRLLVGRDLSTSYIRTARPRTQRDESHAAQGAHRPEAFRILVRERLRRAHARVPGLHDPPSEVTHHCLGLREPSAALSWRVAPGAAHSAANVSVPSVLAPWIDPRRVPPRNARALPATTSPRSGLPRQRGPCGASDGFAAQAIYLAPQGASPRSHIWMSRLKGSALAQPTSSRSGPGRSSRHLPLTPLWLCASVPEQAGSIRRQRPGGARQEGRMRICFAGELRGDTR
jgi:hypothetical protein